MKQQIICQKGNCYEEDAIETEIDSLFDDNNIVKKIQKDMLKSLL